MKTVLEKELITPFNLIYPLSTGKFHPLFNIKQPDSIWYCDNLNSCYPRLEKLTLAEINRIVSRQRKFDFKFFEGFCVPTSVEKKPLNVYYNFTEIADKLFLGNMDNFGIGLFAREDLNDGDKLGFLGGKVITQEFKMQCDLSGDYSCLSHASIFAKGNDNRRAETLTISSLSYGGMLGFAQSAQSKKTKDDQLTENLKPELKAIGNYIFFEFSANKTEAGTPLVWDYGENYWKRHTASNGDPEQPFNTLGEPLSKQNKTNYPIAKGNQYAYQAYSYFQDKQYQLAIRYWKEAYKHYEKFLEKNSNHIQFNGCKLYHHTLCLRYHQNLSLAYQGLGNTEKTTYHRTACHYIQSLLLINNTTNDKMSKELYNKEEDNLFVCDHS